MNLVLSTTFDIDSTMTIMTTNVIPLKGKEKKKKFINYLEYIINYKPKSSFAFLYGTFYT